MFLDSSYVVATGAGFPLTLNAMGTASINLKLYGSLRAPNFYRNRQLELTGSFNPSVALDIVGTMCLDAYYASTAIKLKTNVYTSSAVDGALKIDGAELVSLKFSLPRDETEIFGAQSELIVVKGSQEHTITGLKDIAASRSACSSPLVDKAIGLKLCANYYFANTTKIPHAPYSILAGPSGFKLYLQKADPKDKNYLIEYRWTKTKVASEMSIIFDTPGKCILWFPLSRTGCMYVIII